MTKLTLFALKTACLVFLTSCAALNEIQSASSYKSLVGLTEAEVIAEIGPPKLSRTTFQNQKVIYYNQRWYLIEKGRAAQGEYYSNTKYDVTLKSFFDKEYSSKLKEKTFAIYSGMSQIQPNDLEFKIHSKALAHVLKLKGLVPAKQAKPDYVILLSYGISEPIVDIEVSYRPTFAWVPGVNTSTSGNIGGQNFYANSSSSGHLQNTGYIPEYKKSVNFKRFLVINAYENEADITKAPQVWKISMQSVGFSDDLRPVMGSMLGIAQDWAFGESEGSVRLSVPVNDPMARLAFQ